MKAGLWLDSQLTLEKWQLDALRNIKCEAFEITKILVLRNQESKKRVQASKILYYVTLGIQRKTVGLARKIPISKVSELRNLGITFLEHKSEGGWERLDVQNQNNFLGVDVIIKFESSLIKNPEELSVPFGILSFHHGNPESFRGRPAIFWEMYSKSREIGIIVQKICSRLDSGDVVSQATLKLNNYSYRKNFKNLYLVSTFLLSKAIDNLRKNETKQLRASGRLFRLPSNKDTIKVLLLLVKNKVIFLLYGMFRQKKWWIAKVAIPKSFNSNIKILRGDIAKLEKPAGSYFVADPMVDSDGQVYAEVVSRPSYRGEIFLLNNNMWKKVEFNTSSLAHYSYPQYISEKGHKYIFAETAFHSSPHLLQLTSEGEKVCNIHYLKGLENERVADGTLFKFEKNWYLFGSAQKSNYNLLHLWISESLNGEFREHVASPVCFDVKAQRMGGPILEQGATLIRFGQNCLVNYGSSLSITRIDRLTPNDFHETWVGAISYTEGHGPHTFSVLGEVAFVDGYEELWSIFAIFRKVLARIRR